MIDVLSGVRVVDFGVYFAGPYSSRLLADLGADVIKIESPAGDPMRHQPRAFAAANRNKRAITIDLKQPAGQALALDLAREADVVCHNLRPGVAERLGMGY